VAKLSFSDIGSSLAWLALISFGSRSGRDRSQRLQQKLHDFSRRHMSTHVFAKTAHASEPEEEIKSWTFLHPIVFWLSAKSLSMRNIKSMSNPVHRGSQVMLY